MPKIVSVIHVHNIFARAFQEVIRNFLRPVRVPGGDGLAVGAGVVEVRHVRVEHGGVSGVQFDAALHLAVHVTVHVTLGVYRDESMG